MTAVNIHSVPHSRMVTRIRGYTGDVEWFTPTKYLESVRHVFGGRIDLDPASSDAAQLNVDAKQYFTVDDDGLAQQWRGNIFLNPPYAMPWIDLFVNKIVESYTAKEITQGILLTNNATDTKWFHLALQHCNAVCFTRGRISFIKSINGISLEKGSPAVGQAFFYFGSGASRFESGFSLYGRIVRIIQRGGGQ
jgi:phage N-6-adenine-methyltransferase